MLPNFYLTTSSAGVVHTEKAGVLTVKINVIYLYILYIISMYLYLHIIRYIFLIQEGSWLTFYSSGGLIFGIVNIVGNFGAVFVDQVCR